MTGEDFDTSVAEWGDLRAIIDPKKTRSGHVQEQIDNLLANIFIMPRLLEAVKNELIILEGDYNKSYLIENDDLPKDKVGHNQRNAYIVKKLNIGLGSVGAKLTKYKNRLTRLEQDYDSMKQMLWAYRGGRSGS